MKRSVLVRAGFYVTFCVTMLVWALTSTRAFAEINIVDIAGREVSLAQPAKKVVLGEGRFLSVFGVLDIENPFDYVVGMMNEFRLYDPTGFAQYKHVYPQIEDVPTFGHTNESSVSIEKIIVLNPDVAIFGLNGHGPGSRSKHIVDRLEAAGITVVFIDFRKNPIVNTPKSIELIGAILGKDIKAKAFADTYRTSIDEIRKKVDAIKDEEKPSVLFELRAGGTQECCLTVAKGMFADMAEVAGARSLATGVLPGPVGSLSREFVLSTDFDMYIGTAVGGPESIKEGRYTHLVAGPRVNAVQASSSLESMMRAHVFMHLPFAKQQNVHVLWHHFYNSPLNLYAIQKMAMWFHPKIFADLDPESTLDAMLNGFYPVKLEGTYGATMNIE